MKQIGFAVYLDDEKKPVAIEQATQAKFVKGTDRQSFYLALIQDAKPSDKVSFMRLQHASTPK
jgi:hypothetical protein